MPSRRAVLTAIGTGLTGAAGCSAPGAATGYVQLKSVEARRRRDGQLHAESVLRARLGGNLSEGEVDASVADEWAEYVDTPERPTVDDAFHRELRRAYEEVRYVVGVCSEAWSDSEEYSAGCYNAPAGREDFNRVQVYDRVTASHSTPTLDIHSVEGIWTFEEES